MNKFQIPSFNIDINKATSKMTDSERKEYMEMYEKRDRLMNVIQMMTSSQENPSFNNFNFEKYMNNFNNNKNETNVNNNDSNGNNSNNDNNKINANVNEASSNINDKNNKNMGNNTVVSSNPENESKMKSHINFKISQDGVDNQYSNIAFHTIVDKKNDKNDKESSNEEKYKNNLNILQNDTHVLDDLFEDDDVNDGNNNNGGGDNFNFKYDQNLKINDNDYGL